MRLRVIDWRNKDPTHSAIVSVWRPNEDVQHHLKENRSYHLYSVSAGGLRFGELQLNSSSHTVWKEMKDDTNVQFRLHCHFVCWFVLMFLSERCQVVSSGR